MSEFWIAAAAMIVVALAFILPSFFRPRRASDDDSRGENIAAAREHLRELRRRNLSDEDAAEYETEIKMRLLDDAGDPVAAGAKDEEASPAADKFGAALASVLLLCGAPALYWHLGAPSAAALAPPDLNAAIAGLQKHIADNPEDAEALALMGRTLTALGREKEAADYFARAIAARSALSDPAREQQLTDENN